MTVPRPVRDHVMYITADRAKGAECFEQRLILRAQSSPVGNARRYGLDPASSPVPSLPSALCARRRRRRSPLPPARSRRRRGRAVGAGPALGALAQLRGANGCLVDRSEADPGMHARAGTARAGSLPRLRAPSRSALTGRNVYVASSRSNAIAIFQRNATDRRADAARRRRRMHRRRGRRAAARPRVALDGPNSVAVSADGKQRLRDLARQRRGRRSSAATRRRARSRRRTTAAAASPNAAISGCTAGRALDGPDVVTVSPDGRERLRGRVLRQRGRGVRARRLDRRADAAGRRRRLHRRAPTDGCATGIALGAPEGMAISGDGNNVYVAAAVSNARRRARPRPVDRRAHAGDRRQRLHRRRPARRLHDRHPARRRQRGRGQPRRRRRLRDLAAQQQPDLVHPHAVDAASSPSSPAPPPA